MVQVLLFVLQLTAFIYIEAKSASISWPSDPIVFDRRTVRRQPQIIFVAPTPIVAQTTPAVVTSTATTSTTTEIPSTSTTTTTELPNCTPPEVPKNQLPEDSIRSKLCSNITGVGLRNFRFDLSAKVCSQVGRQSHCGKNMVFYSLARNNLFGHCDCDYSSPVPLIYHEETNRCYYMYQQAYCHSDEWLELGKTNGKPICSNNRCINSGRPRFGAAPLAARDMEPEFVPLNGEGPCVRLNQPNDQFCKKGDIVAFRWPLEFYPSCGAPAKPQLQPEGPSVKFLGGVPALQCSPGSYLTATGHCQHEWDFD